LQTFYYKNITRLIVVVTLVCISVVNANSQTVEALKKATTENFTFFNYKNGLSNDYITSIVQDDEGFIWVGTINGLNRFDGKEFINYTIGNPIINLPSRHISYLKKMGNHLLGIATRQGFVLLNTQSYKNTLFQNKDTTIFNGYLNGTWDACILEDGRIAITTATGFYVFTPTGEISFRYDAFKITDIEKKRVLYGREIYSLGKHEYLIFIHNKEIAYFNSLTNEYVHQSEKQKIFYPPFNKTKFNFLQNNEIGNSQFLFIDHIKDSIIYYDKNIQKCTASKLPFNVNKEIDWFARPIALNDSVYLLNANHGFYILTLDKSTGVIKTDTNKILPAIQSIYSFVDKEKRLWIGSTTGLYKQNLNSKIIHSIFNNVVSTKSLNSYNNSILHYKNKYYVGKYAKYDSALQIINAKTLQIEKKIMLYNGKDEWNEILSIQQYHKDTLWISTNMGLIWFDINNYSYGKINFPTEYLMYNNSRYPVLYPPDKYGNAWILYIIQGTVAKYNIASRIFTFYSTNSFPKLPFQKIKLLTYDSYGNVWIAGHGLCRYNYATNSFDNYMSTYGGSNKYNENITALMGDNIGNLLIQSADNDLLRYKIKENTFFVINNSAGISNDVIQSFSACVDGKIWMRQLHNLICFDVNTNQIQNYSEKDGLPSDIALVNNMYFDTTNQMLITFNKTQLSFIPAYNKILSNSVNELIISSIDADDKPSFFNEAQKISFAYGIKKILIYFTVIDFENPEVYHFFYTLDDKEWISLKTNRVIQLNNLSPGTYNLTIKSVDKYGREVQKQLKIKIATPFWKEWWFIFSSLIILLFSAVKFIKYRESNLKKNAQIQLQTQQLKTEQLQVQLEMEQINNYFTSAVANTNTVDEVIWGVAKNLIGKLGFEDCMIYLWNEDKTKMVQKAGYGPKGSIEEIIKQPFDVVPGQGIVGYVMQTKEAIIIPDTSLESRYRKDEMTRLSEICIPIIYNNELMGIIDSEHSQKNFYTQRHLQIMTTISALTINKIKSIESETGLNQKKIEVAELNQQLTEFEMKALLTQMNPHFIFNSLGTIKTMILDDQKEEASKYLGKFAKMIRLTLDHSTESFISLNQNNEYIRYYAEIENLRFNNVFEFEIIVDTSINKEEVKIPPMMIQPLVENAIWHGLLKKEGLKKLQLKYTFLGSMLQCTVEDNGIGINSSKNKIETHKSVGINNIRQRLSLLNEKYHTQCSLIIKDKSELGETQTGTIAFITLPYIL
jgi:ligand-binding sensor domain-containing protein/putative methionine-R-sulfoxide reductase with GAF domain